MALNSFVLPEGLRKKFKRPKGKVFASVKKIKIPFGTVLITVGDIVSFSAINAGLKPHIIIFDGKVERSPASQEVTDVLEGYEAKKITVANPPGRITSELWKAVKSCFPFKKRVKIFVRGEEDLAVLPIILEAPGGVVLSGLPGKGIVLLEINEKLKNICSELLKQMDRF